MHTKMNRGHSVPMEPLQLRAVGQPSFMELQDEEVARELREKEAVSGEGEEGALSTACSHIGRHFVAQRIQCNQHTCQCGCYVWC